MQRVNALDCEVFMVPVQAQRRSNFLTMNKDGSMPIQSFNRESAASPQTVLVPCGPGPLPPIAAEKTPTVNIALPLLLQLYQYTGLHFESGLVNRFS